MPLDAKSHASHFFTEACMVSQRLSLDYAQTKTAMVAAVRTGDT
jgi:hypothetical protein